MVLTSPSRETSDVDLAALEHPRGTLAIVAVFGLLFALAWLAMFFFTFLGRGATHH